jgi:2-polyprenyl-3-methyl-5-hydroxy-6-metoxy-1,4-benzoquinol methylase
MLCPACASASLRHSFRFSRGDVASCPSCGLQLAHDETVSEAQDSQFHEALDEATYVSYFEPFRKGQYEHVLSKLHPPKGSKLLDVGASFGWMLNVGDELGLDCHGLEPSPMRYGPDLAGRITCATLDEYADQAKERFDLVTLWHVLEHLRDPFAAIRNVLELLSANGRAVIAVPNADGRMYKMGSLLARRLATPRLMEELWYTHNPNMHRYYPTLPALTFMLRSEGLRVIDAYTLEAFDWRRIWVRGGDPFSRNVLRIVGPVLDLSGFTRAENLVVIAEPV